MFFRRSIQFVSLGLFLAFLLAAVTSQFGYLPVDGFLRMDPVLFVGTAISTRTLTLGFLPAIVILVLTPVLGRFFCGHICPMGVTLDITDKYLARKNNKTTINSELFNLKYWVLFFILGSGLLGISAVFIASPLSLITRFYGLLIEPVLALAGSYLLSLIQPLASELSLYSLSFLQVDQPRFTTQFFLLIFFVSVFGLAKYSPRFWCRYLCPSGGLLALLSIKPLLGRRVGGACDDCGKCVGPCRMEAIPASEPRSTKNHECILCRTCEDVCPLDAISFGLADKKPVEQSQGFPLSRRVFVSSTLAGVGVAAVSLTGLNSVYGKENTGQVLPPGLIRPPGSIPEKDFLAECVRCGECAAACPTNTIQHVWGKAGVVGVFSPALVARRAGCDPECNVCGLVCPTEAITIIPSDTRFWAKVGTAVIARQQCLAWEYKKKCLVCDEVCPFDAVEFKEDPGNPVAVPHVIEEKCPGCGYCEMHCPVQNESAIIISAMGALRLKDGDYRKEARRLGLKYVLRTKGTYGLGVVKEDKLYQGPAPGFKD